MPRLTLPTPNFFNHWSLGTRRWILAWLGSVVLLVIVVGVGRHLASPVAVIEQIAILFVINSAVFLATVRDYPKLGLVMILFTYFLLLATLGYFVLAGATFSA